MAWHGRYIRAILDAVLASEVGCEFGRSRRGFGLSATTSPWLRAVGLRILQEARGRLLGLTWLLLVITTGYGVSMSVGRFRWSTGCRLAGWEYTPTQHARSRSSSSSIVLPFRPAACWLAGELHVWDVGGDCHWWRRRNVASGWDARVGIPSGRGHASCWILVARDGVVAVELIGRREEVVCRTGADRGILGFG